MHLLAEVGDGHVVHVSIGMAEQLVALGVHAGDLISRDGELGNTVLEINVDKRLIPRFLQHRQRYALSMQHRLKIGKFRVKARAHGIIEQVSELQPRQRRRGMVDDCTVQHGTPSIVLVISNHIVINC